MDDKDTMLLQYGSLPDGHTQAGERCPACGGGRTGERTLSVSRSGSTLLWHCHRASCGYSGRTGGAMAGTRTVVPNSRGVAGRQLVREAVSIPDEVRKELSAKLFLTDRHINKWQLGWDETSSRLVQPVFDRHGEVLGCQLRALDGRQPKAISHTEQGAISWYTNPATSGLIIVEDIFSAIRAADHVTSVALLSTHLNDERVQQIRETGLSPVWLALDADAFAKVISYTKKYRNVLPMIPVKLTKDLKNMNPDELKEFFDEDLRSTARL